MNWIRRHFPNLSGLDLMLLALVGSVLLITVIALRRYDALLFLPLVAYGGLRLEKAVKSRTIVWNAPPVMRVGRQQVMTVHIGSDAAELAAARNPAGAADRLSVQSALPPQLRVKLVFDAADFSVQALNSDEQALLRGELASWAFLVTPLRRGEWTLRLRVTRIFDGGEKRRENDLKLLEHKVRVEAAPLRAIWLFVRTYWVKVAGALLAAALTVVLGLWGLSA